MLFNFVYLYKPIIQIMNTFSYISTVVEVIVYPFPDFLPHNMFDRHIQYSNLVQQDKNPQIHCHLAKYCCFHIAKMYDPVLLCEICRDIIYLYFQFIHCGIITSLLYLFYKLLELYIKHSDI